MPAAFDSRQTTTTDRIHELQFRGARGESQGPEPVTILMVDDDADVRGIVAEFLEAVGHVVLQAGGGAEALELLRAHPETGMVISDIRMPGMSGLELADLAASRRAGLKIILISGYFPPQPVSRRLLRKPFRMKDLECAVREELAS